MCAQRGGNPNHTHIQVVICWVADGNADGEDGDGAAPE